MKTDISITVKRTEDSGYRGNMYLGFTALFCGVLSVLLFISGFNAIGYTGELVYLSAFLLSFIVCYVYYNKPQLSVVLWVVIFIGIFIDLITMMNIISLVDNLFIGIVMLVIGMVFMGLGTCIYLSCELGCGPRDGLMTALTRITKKPVKVIRTTIEVCALICGWLLGGYVGIGTIITAIGLGYIIQMWCKILKLDIAVLNHRSIIEDIKKIIEKY